MNPPHFSRRVAKGLYRVCRTFVHFLGILAVLAIVVFVFLRIHGVPGPLLREVMRHVNAAGIPVQMDGVILTLSGWRADGVRYYSANPDDLEPLFESRQVFFSAQTSTPKDADSKVWNVEVEAVGVGMNPSVEWGVAIPRNHPSRKVEKIKVSLEFLSDRIVLSDGKMDWLGSRFNVNGTILKRKKRPGEVPDKPPVHVQDTVLPVLIDEAQFQTLEKRLEMVSLPNGTTVDIDFKIDTADYSASRVDLSINAEEVGFRGVGFSRAEIVGSYAYPQIKVERAGLFQDNQSVQLSGEYDLDSKEVGGSLYNSITSNRLLLLLPEKTNGSLAEAGLRIDQLPRLEINFGPAAAKELPNHLSGAFSIRGLGYQGLEIEVLRGRVKRENNRLEFTELQASAFGQEERAEETGSAMHGGFAAGSVFWDGNTREFGVDVDASLDPNILVQALSPIKIATNIIQRFRFADQPPHGHVSVGADLDDLETFYIDIQAMASEVAIQGVEFSSVNITQTYKHGKLNLNPIAAMQGADSTEGSVMLDFRNSTATFDILSRLDPADLENLICPNLNLFGNRIKVDGNVQLVARGVFDWGSMQQTDFSMQVEAAKLEIPVGELDRFTADIMGDGPVIAVNGSKFGLYGGEGEGRFSIAWNPGVENLPYVAGFSFSGVDFNQCLLFLRGGSPIDISGRMDGNIHIQADLATNFFSTANGKGFVNVEDGQLADLPLFNGFSRLMRKVLPSFSLFSITGLRGNFTIENGTILSEDAYFEGDVLSAKGQGCYCQSTGFDMLVQVQMLSESMISKVVRVITDPLLKIFEMKLTGPLSDPTWQLDKFRIK